MLQEAFQIEEIVQTDVLEEGVTMEIDGIIYVGVGE